MSATLQEISLPRHRHERLTNLALSHFGNGQLKLAISFLRQAEFEGSLPAQEVLWGERCIDLGDWSKLPDYKALSDFERAIMYMIGSADKSSMTTALTILKQLSSPVHNDALAQNVLGDFYTLGQVPGFPKDSKKANTKAVEWYVQSATQGCVQAQTSLSLMYVEGRVPGCPVDSAEAGEQALKWCAKAASKGYAYAQTFMGDIYYGGHVADYPKDSVEANTKAFEWYTRAASKGYVHAQRYLGLMYVEGHVSGYPKDSVEAKTKAFEWFHKAAVQGDADAQYEVGVRYFHGYGSGIPKDSVEAKTKAFEWLHKAASQEGAGAQFNLGVMYFDGFVSGYPKDSIKANTKAFEWYHKAAIQGYADAQFGLGVMYFQGLVSGYPKDSIEANTKAFEWFHKVASQGYAEAQHKLGFMYVEGFVSGYPKDSVEANTKAFEWLHKAASQGDAEAQFKLGYMYFDGFVSGLPKASFEANTKAFKWFHKAASQGDAEAQLKLGFMYVEGQISDSRRRGVKALEHFLRAGILFRQRGKQSDVEYAFSLIKSRLCLTPQQITYVKSLMDYAGKQTNIAELCESLSKMSRLSDYVAFINLDASYNLSFKEFSITFSNKVKSWYAKITSETDLANFTVLAVNTINALMPSVETFHLPTIDALTDMLMHPKLQPFLDDIPIDASAFNHRLSFLMSIEEPELFHNTTLTVVKLLKASKPLLKCLVEEDTSKLRLLHILAKLFNCEQELETTINSSVISEDLLNQLIQIAIQLRPIDVATKKEVRRTRSTTEMGFIEGGGEMGHNSDDIVNSNERLYRQGLALISGVGLTVDTTPIKVEMLRNMLFFPGSDRSHSSTMKPYINTGSEQQLRKRHQFKAL